MDRSEALIILRFPHCGIHFSNASSGLSVDIANLEIAVGTDCVVSYDMNVSETAVYGETISSTTDISSANEGGNDPDSFDADTLTVTTIGTIGFTISKPISPFQKMAVREPSPLS